MSDEGLSAAMEMAEGWPFFFLRLAVRVNIQLQFEP